MSPTVKPISDQARRLNFKERAKARLIAGRGYKSADKYDDLKLTKVDFDTQTRPFEDREGLDKRYMYPKNLYEAMEGRTGRK